ncbi:hypothetical protein [Pseudomonas sp. Marseille-Q5115]|uniref:hypothetical protein n=1 Tax=Pseudomonas sp. Marseille-Q5115 TaxID=2866593 RepID=UPI001CE3E2E4|nr:hypothetical protein [Pseudomonas sp. Marseille-Q5115]
MTSMKERREKARENIASMLEHAPEWVDKKAWLYEQLGITDFDEPYFDAPDIDELGPRS